MDLGFSAASEAGPFPLVLHAGLVVAQADSRFLGASLLGMTSLGRVPLRRGEAASKGLGLPHPVGNVGTEHTEVPLVVGVDGLCPGFDRARRQERIVDRCTQGPVRRRLSNRRQVFGTIERYDREVILDVCKEKHCLLGTCSECARQARYSGIDLGEAVGSTACDSFIGRSVNG